jgi:hypothetical protein
MGNIVRNGNLIRIKTTIVKLSEDVVTAMKTFPSHEKLGLEVTLRGKGRGMIKIGDHWKFAFVNIKARSNKGRLRVGQLLINSCKIDISMCGMSFKGISPVVFCYCNILRLNDCKIVGDGEGIVARSCQQIFVDGCQIRSKYSDAMVCDNLECGGNVHLKDCRLSGARKSAALFISGNTAVKLDDCSNGKKAKHKFAVVATNKAFVDGSNSRLKGRKAKYKLVEYAQAR